MASLWCFSLLFPWWPVVALGPEVISLNDLTDLRVCTSNILRLTRWPSKEAREKGRISLVAKSDWPHTDYHVLESPEEIKVTTSKVSFSFSKAMGNASFSEMLSPHEFLLQDAGHSFKVTEDMGKESHEIRQSWRSRSPSEAFYGGGSYQNGLLNYKNAPLLMIQFNLEAVVPFFVSSEGYGLLWDNYAWTYLNPPAAENALVKPIAGKGQSGEVQFQAAASGDYFFHVGRLMSDAKVPSFGGGHETIITAQGEGSNTTIIRWTRDQQNHPSSITGRLSNMKAGVKYTIHFSFDIPGAGLYVQGPDYNGGLTTLQSQYAEAIDYYYVYGPAVDNIIAGYREITGIAPLYGKFAYGFWQSREHYGSQAELLEAAKQFRSRAIPIDAIVQEDGPAPIQAPPAAPQEQLVRKAPPVSLGQEPLRKAPPKQAILRKAPPESGSPQEHVGKLPPRSPQDEVILAVPTKPPPPIPDDLRERRSQVSVAATGSQEPMSRVAQPHLDEVSTAKAPRTRWNRASQTQIQ